MRVLVFTGVLDGMLPSLISRKMLLEFKMLIFS